MSETPTPNQKAGKLTKAQRLVTEIERITGLSDVWLIPAKGYYRCRRVWADVQAYTGWGTTPEGFKRSIGSWETMTDALKYGFAVFCDVADRTAYSDYNIQPFSPKSGCKPGDGEGYWLPAGARREIAEANSRYSGPQLEEIVRRSAGRTALETQGEEKKP